MVQDDRCGIDTADEAAWQNSCFISSRTVGDLIGREIENDLDASFRDDHFPAIIRHSINLPPEENRIRGKSFTVDKKRSVHAPVTGFIVFGSFTNSPFSARSPHDPPHAP